MTVSTNYPDLGGSTALRRRFVLAGGLGFSKGPKRLTLREYLAMFVAWPQSSALADASGQGADLYAFCVNQKNVNFAVACPNESPIVTRPAISRGLVSVLAFFAVFAASNTVFNDFA